MRTPVLQGLFGKIGKQTIPDPLRSDVHHAAGESEVLLCGDREQILNQAVMEGTCFRAGRGKLSHVQKQDLALFGCDHIAKQLLTRN